MSNSAVELTLARDVQASDKPRRRGKPGIRAERQSARREEVLAIAARLFRTQGMATTTIADIAFEMGNNKVVLYRRYPSKEALIDALFNQVTDAIIEADKGPWQGYGSRLGRSLAAIRSVEDGYVALVRDGNLYSQTELHGLRLREHTKSIIRRTLNFPAVSDAHDPLAAAMCIEVITTFTHQALAWWLQNGVAARDSEFLSWFAYMMRAWREGALDLFGLGDAQFHAPAGPIPLPEVDKSVPDR